MKKKKIPDQEAPRAEAASAAKSLKVRKEKSQKEKLYVVIDFPMEGEIIRSGSYTFRLGGSPADRVEVSIDKRDWQACRPEVGYWWYDWSGYSAGPHTVQARISPSGKRAVKSKPRQFTVLI
jgi:hypothetical protein